MRHTPNAKADAKQKGRVGPPSPTWRWPLPPGQTFGAALVWLRRPPQALQRGCGPLLPAKHHKQTKQNQFSRATHTAANGVRRRQTETTLIAYDVCHIPIALTAVRPAGTEQRNTRTPTNPRAAHIARCKCCNSSQAHAYQGEQRNRDGALAASVQQLPSMLAKGSRGTKMVRSLQVCNSFQEHAYQGEQRNRAGVFEVGAFGACAR
jgi:hypothetical protein